jgi:ABC-type sugar transport system substrate-binding protein
MFPCGNPIPEASNLNFAAGQTIANAVVARVGSNGQVCVYVSGSAGLLVDVNGFVPAGSNLTALFPVRLFDSRSGGGARTPNSVTEVQVAGLGGVPSQARTAMLNVTAVQASAAGFMTMFPCGTPVPTASNLNYAAGQTIANAVVAKIGDGGRVCIYTSAAAHLIVDVNGTAP